MGKGICRDPLTHNHESQQLSMLAMFITSLFIDKKRKTPRLLKGVGVKRDLIRKTIHTKKRSFSMRGNIAQTVLPFKLEEGNRDDEIIGLAGLPLVYEFMHRSGLCKQIKKHLKLIEKCNHRKRCHRCGEPQDGRTWDV